MFNFFTKFAEMVSTPGGLFTAGASMIAGAGASFGIGSMIATAIGATLTLSNPVGWAVLIGGAVVGLVAATIGWGLFNQNKTDGLEAIQNLENERANQIIEVTAPDPSQLQANAQKAAGWGNQGLTDEQKNAMAAANQGLGETAQPPTVEEMQQAVNNQSLQSQEEALNRFNDMLAQLNQGGTPADIMGALQEANKLDNPLTDTIGENEEDTEEKIEEEIEKYEEELDFDKGDFDDLDGYKFMINNTLVTLYVKSEINLISEDENFQNMTNSNITSKKYIDNKGQTHAISSAYDADGNKLDKVIKSSQIGYLEVGLDGANGTAKFSGTGNEDAYEVHGYGETSFGKIDYEVSIKGTYELKDNEKEKESLLGTNSEIIAQKEYKFKDAGSIEIAESETNALFDTFKASINWSCDVMREVNLQSYVLDMGDVEFIMGEATNEDEEDNDIDVEEIEIEENGITYTYNENATLINPQTGATYLVKDLLEQEIITMEELIEKGFEPNTINGKEYEDEEDLEDAKTSTKPKFTIKIDEAEGIENYERETIYIDEDGTRYYFTTKCSHRYHIVLETGEEYTIEEALEIYTIEELMDNGLDCKISAI